MGDICSSGESSSHRTSTALALELARSRPFSAAVSVLSGQNWGGRWKAACGNARLRGCSGRAAEASALQWHSGQFPQQPAAPGRLCAGSSELAGCCWACRKFCKKGYQLQTGGDYAPTGLQLVLLWPTSASPQKKKHLGAEPSPALRSNCADAAGPRLNPRVHRNSPATPSGDMGALLLCKLFLVPTDICMRFQKVILSEWQLVITHIHKLN